MYNLYILLHLVLSINSKEYTPSADHHLPLTSIFHTTPMREFCLGFRSSDHFTLVRWVVSGITVYDTMSYRDYFINHEIRIPINQPGFNGK